MDEESLGKRASLICNLDQASMYRARRRVCRILQGEHRGYDSRIRPDFGGYSHYAVTGWQQSVMRFWREKTVWITVKFSVSLMSWPIYSSFG